jgi:hypothetical protein
VLTLACLYICIMGKDEEACLHPGGSTVLMGVHFNTCDSGAKEKSPKSTRSPTLVHFIYLFLYRPCDWL